MSKKGAVVVDDPRYYQRTIEKHTLASVHLATDRHVRVYLPPGFAAGNTYPVIYCQDGEQFFNFGRIATQMTRLIIDGLAAPSLIIGIDVDLKERTAEYAPEGRRFAAYTRFVAEELVPWIGERYPVRPAAEGAILAGGSLGGTVSLHLALMYPQLFTKVLALSGAFLAATQQFVESQQDLSCLQIYMLIGRQETAVPTERGTFDFLRANRITCRLLAEKHANVRYVEKDGEHRWGFWQQELPEGLRWFLG